MRHLSSTISHYKKYVVRRILVPAVSIGFLFQSQPSAAATLDPRCSLQNAKIIRNASEWNASNVASASILCLSPGITYPKISSSAHDKTVLITTGNRSPWASPKENQAILKGIEILGSNWKFEGITFQGTSSENDLVEVRGSNATFRYNLFKDEQDLIVFFQQGGLVERNVFIHRTQLSSSNANSDGICIRSKPGGNNLIIQDNEFMNCGDAFQANPPGNAAPPSNLTFQRNVVYVTPAMYGKCQGYAPKCVNGQCSQGTEFNACAGTENVIDIKLSAGNYIIRDNIMYGFRETNPALGQTGSRGEAIVFHDGPHSSTAIIERNILFDGAAGFFVGSDQAGNFAFRNNLITECCTYSGGAHSVEADIDYRIFNIHQIHHVTMEGNVITDPLASPGSAQGEWLRITAADNVSVKNNAISGQGWEGKLTNTKTSTQICGNRFTSDVPTSARFNVNCSTPNTTILKQQLGASQCVAITPYTNPGKQKCFTVGLPAGFQSIYGTSSGGSSSGSGTSSGSTSGTTSSTSSGSTSGTTSGSTSGTISSSSGSTSGGSSSGGTPAVNLIKNGDFSDGNDSWQFYGGSSQNSFTVTDEKARVEINKKSDNIQLYQHAIRLIAGKDYTLSFKAKATENRELGIYLQQHAEPYTNLGLEKTVRLTNTMQTFTMPFTASASTSNARLRFWLTETVGSTVIIDDVTLKTLP